MYCITNIAVKPSLRSTRIGTEVLKSIMKLFTLNKGQYWIAHVDEQNTGAKSFFERNGWKYAKRLSGNEDMILFEYRNL